MKLISAKTIFEYSEDDNQFNQSSMVDRICSSIQTMLIQKNYSKVKSLYHHPDDVFVTFRLFIQDVNNVLSSSSTIEPVTNRLKEAGWSHVKFSELVGPPPALHQPMMGAPYMGMPTPMVMTQQSHPWWGDPIAQMRKPKSKNNADIPSFKEAYDENLAQNTKPPTNVVLDLTYKV